MFSLRQSDPRKSRRKKPFIFPSAAALALNACGSSSEIGDAPQISFTNTYDSPKSNFVPPSEIDPNFEVLKPNYIEPYWVAALEMDGYETQIFGMLAEHERKIEYAFPSAQPDYENFGVLDWQPATVPMKVATQEILKKIEGVLDVSFVEVDDVQDTNVMAIGRSNQSGTSGFSYFPNTFYEVGMDVFIAKAFADPKFSTDLVTNYDYEVLVHEIGHALGLKHPFEPHQSNSATLNSYEDQTLSTAMSYNDNPITFNGTFRPLDWMTLAKYYGVNPGHQAGNDTYYFSPLGGTFVIDGAGIDTIDAAESLRDVVIDLRPGAHSYLGSKSPYITEGNQLTISHGSDIENVRTGSGNDTVIANDLGNEIETGSGNDIIFAGGGSDVVKSGTGSDQIDLSELIQAVDVVNVVTSLFDLGTDAIYGFVQGISGDVINVTDLLFESPTWYPLISTSAPPTGNFSGGVLRIFGEGIDTSRDVEHAFALGGALSSLVLNKNERAVILTSNSQETGADQNIFFGVGVQDAIEISHIAVLHGNALDIDEWHAENFGFVT